MELPTTKGGKGGKIEVFPDNAAVVRGGTNNLERIANGTGTHPEGPTIPKIVNGN